MYKPITDISKDVSRTPPDSGDLIPLADIGRTQKAFNSATDVYLVAFPAYIFWNLNLNPRTKLGLMILLGLGTL